MIIQVQSATILGLDRGGPWKEGGKLWVLWYGHSNEAFSNVGRCGVDALFLVGPRFIEKRKHCLRFVETNVVTWL